MNTNVDHIKSMEVVTQVEEGLVDYAVALALCASPIGALAGGMHKCVVSGAVTYQQFACSTPSAEVEGWKPTGLSSVEAPARTNVVVESNTKTVSLNSLKLSAQRNGGYYTHVKLNYGASKATMVDTGASYLTIDTKDMVSAGMSCDSYTYTHTANALSSACKGVIPRVEVGGIVVTNVTALAMDGVKTTLLGQSFLRHVKVEQVDGFLTMTELPPKKK